jgi:hypothetical protein
MTRDVKRRGRGAKARRQVGDRYVLWNRLPPAFAAAGQQYQVSMTWSFFGSAGLLLLADIAQATIITATINIYAPRANRPNMAPASLGFFAE